MVHGMAQHFDNGWEFCGVLPSFLVGDLDCDMVFTLLQEDTRLLGFWR